MNAAIIQRVLELRVYMATQRSCLGEWKVVRYEHNQSPFGRLGLRDGSGDRWFPVAFDVSDEAKDFLTLLVKGGVQHDLDGEHAEGTCLLIYSHETDVAAAIIRTPCRFFVGAPDAPEPSIENGGIPARPPLPPRLERISLGMQQALKAPGPWGCGTLIYLFPAAYCLSLVVHRNFFSGLGSELFLCFLGATVLTLSALTVIWAFTGAFAFRKCKAQDSADKWLVTRANHQEWCSSLQRTVAQAVSCLTKYSLGTGDSPLDEVKAALGRFHGHEATLRAWLDEARKTGDCPAVSYWVCYEKAGSELMAAARVMEALERDYVSYETHISFLERHGFGHNLPRCLVVKEALPDLADHRDRLNQLMLDGDRLKRLSDKLAEHQLRKVLSEQLGKLGETITALTIALERHSTNMSRQLAGLTRNQLDSQNDFRTFAVELFRTLDQPSKK